MVTAKKYAEMLGMEDEELRKYINSLSSNNAKELLFHIISFSNKNRKKELDELLRHQN